MFVDSAHDDNYCLVAIIDCFLWESSNGTVLIMESSILHSTAVVAAPILKLCSIICGVDACCFYIGHCELLEQLSP